MCGIIGQLRHDGQRADAGLAARMCAALEHRGPDARGLHVDGGVALGIQRLRVIDLATGDQPIYNEDRSVVVVLNGEIYNYRELRAELLRARAHARDAGRHRGHRPPVRGVRRGLRPAAARHVRVRALGRAPQAAADRPRPRGQEAARLQPAGRRPQLRLRDGRPARGPRDPSRGRPRGDRRLPRARLRAGPPHRDPRRAQAAARPHAGRARRPRPARAVLDARLCGEARRRPGRGAVRADPCGAARGHPQADDRRRAARRVPLGRHRLVGRRRRDGSAVERARAHVLDRLRPPGVRRAAACAPGRAAVRDRARGVPGPRRGRRDRAQDRPPLRRAVRGLVGDPELLPRGAHPAARHRRAQRRRRRRVLRRLHALRRQRARRPARPDPRTRAPCARRRRRRPPRGRERVQPAQPRPPPRQARSRSTPRSATRGTWPGSTRGSAGSCTRPSSRPGAAPRPQTRSPTRGRRRPAPRSSTRCSRSTSPPISRAT